MSSPGLTPAPRGSVAARRSTAFNPSTATPSRLSKSTSTPYQLYSSSPLRRPATFSSTPIRSSIYHDNTSNASSPVFRRNAGFGSPGMRPGYAASRSSYDASRSSSPAPAPSSRLAASSPANVNSPSASPLATPASGVKKSRPSRGYVRRKPWTEKLKSFPVDWFYLVQSQLMDFEEVFYNPSFGYPIALGLHILSLLSHLISPDSSLGSTLTGKPTRSRAFGGTASGSSSARSGSSFGGAGRSQQLRKLARAQAEAWLRWTSIGLSLALVAISCYNAYILFTSKRSYRLWMRSEKDKVNSENARLVPTYVDEAGKPSIQERLGQLALSLLRDVPVVGWFVPAEERPATPVDEIRMHQIDVWQAPEVPLRIFSVYSPAHALWWQFASLLGVNGPLTWLFSLALMAMFAFQVHFLVRTYNGLVKDRNLLAAEVMHEYNEKFVIPRAMPLVRDASTMTSQAETISPSDWQ